MRSEFQFINDMKSRYDLKKVGDDCAVLPKDDKTYLLITSDMLVEGVDFITHVRESVAGVEPEEDRGGRGAPAVTAMVAGDTLRTPAGAALAPLLCAWLLPAWGATLALLAIAAGYLTLVSRRAWMAPAARPIATPPTNSARRAMDPCASCARTSHHTAKVTSIASGHSFIVTASAPSPIADVVPMATAHATATPRSRAGNAPNRIHASL